MKRILKEMSRSLSSYLFDIWIKSLKTTAKNLQQDGRYYDFPQWKGEFCNETLSSKTNLLISNFSFIVVQHPL